MKLSRCFLVLLLHSPWTSLSQPDGTCTVGEDGACLSSDEELPALPDPSDDGRYPVGYGLPQLVEGEAVEQTQLVIRQMMAYMRRVFREDDFSNVKRECQNRHELCAFWAAIGEWYVNMEYRESCFLSWLLIILFFSSVLSFVNTQRRQPQLHDAQLRPRLSIL